MALDRLKCKATKRQPQPDDISHIYPLARKRRDFEGEAGPMDDYCEHEGGSGSDESDDDDDDDTAASSIEQVDTDEEDQDDFVVDDDVIDGVKVVPSEKDDSAIALPGQLNEKGQVMINLANSVGVCIARIRCIQHIPNTKVLNKL